MSLADALTRLTVDLTVHPDGELAHVRALVDHPDWMEIDEDEDGELYRWSCVLSLPLVSGEVRRGMREGTHDDANLCDNVPSAVVNVPRAQLRAPVKARVRGEIVFKSGPRIAWDQELTPDDGAMPLVETDTAPTVERSTTRPGVAVRHGLPVPSPDAHVVACLPDRGLVAWSRTTGYSLITSNGVRALPQVEALITGMPGVDPSRRSHRGGPRGRLAIWPTRNEDHVLVVEIDDEGVRKVHEQTKVRPTRGGFDATGSLLVVLTNTHERIDDTREVFYSWAQVLDCDRAGLLPWRGGSPGLRGRCEIDGDVMSCTGDYGRLELVRRSGPAVTTKVDVAVGSHPASAWNPIANVAAWTDDGARDLPSALHCYHPSWGIRPVTLPSRGEPIAVLRDGRVVVDAEHLLLVDPATGDITDLGSSEGYFGELPQLVERDGSATLWTLAPSSWRIDLPPRG